MAFRTGVSSRKIFSSFSSSSPSLSLFRSSRVLSKSSSFSVNFTSKNKQYSLLRSASVVHGSFQKPVTTSLGLISSSPPHLINSTVNKINEQASFSSPPSVLSFSRALQAQSGSGDSVGIALEDDMSSENDSERKKNESLPQEEEEDKQVLMQKITEMKEAIEKNEKKTKELQDRLLRALADIENNRITFNREIEKTRTFGVSNFAKEMLEVADNFDLAMSSFEGIFDCQSDKNENNDKEDDYEDITQKEKNEISKEQLQSIFNGLKMTENLLHKTMGKFGVELYDPNGEKFDPKLHEALFEMTDPSQPKGLITQVVKKGYRIHDRILRAAKVGVNNPQ